jgi:hypothetical protein
MPKSLQTPRIEVLSSWWVQDSMACVGRDTHVAEGQLEGRSQPSHPICSRTCM